MDKINTHSQIIGKKILAPDGIEVSVFYSSKVSRGVVISSDLAVLLSRKRVITSLKELPSIKLLLRNKYLHSYFFKIEDILNKLNIIEYLPTLYTEYLNMYNKPLTLKQSVIVPDIVLSESTNGWLFPIRGTLPNLYPLF
ncbi:MAG: hypothetical protein J7L47_07515 [Candidatus Odinarchaeota archaeon]|nr:hypothetical protein [Candidatus Odinarchaeota archaeon]